MIDGFITFLGVSDLKRTSSFYNLISGIELVLDQGKCRIYRTAGDAYLGFCEHLECSPNSGLILAFVTDHVDELFALLKDAGAEVEKEPRENETYGIYHCFVKDPDGYRIEIQRFMDPDWGSI